MPKLKNKEKKSTKTLFEVGSDNIFIDLGFPEEEAVSLLARTDLTIEIQRIIKKNGWTQRRAAKELGVAQPRIAELMGTKIDHYSVDILLKYLNKLGRRVTFVIEKKDQVA